MALFDHFQIKRIVELVIYILDTSEHKTIILDKQVYQKKKFLSSKLTQSFVLQYNSNSVFKHLTIHFSFIFTIYDFGTK